MKYLSLLCLTSVLLLAPACRWGGNRCCGPVVSCAPACVTPCVEPCAAPCVEPCAAPCVEQCATPCADVCSSSVCSAAGSYGAEAQGGYAVQGQQNGAGRQSYAQDEGLDDLGDDAGDFDEAPAAANGKGGVRGGAADLDEDAK